MDNPNKVVFKLRNGITGLIIPVDTQLTDVSVSILLGENHEKPNETEITHYMEHLMARFTSQKYQDYKMISRELHKRGAISNAYVNNYETKFFIQGFYKDVEFYMDLLANTISNFHLEKSLVKQEKNAVIQELQGYSTNPYYIFNMKMWRYLYYKYAYQLDYAKHIKFIKNYKSENIYKYIQDHILLHNVIISVSCPLRAIKKTKNLIKKYFDFPNKNKNKLIKYPVYQYNNRGLKVIYVSNKHYKNDNVEIKLTVDGIIKYLSTKHIALSLLREILFNFETGIFYKKLRDELGLVYNVGIDLNVDIANPVLSSYSINTSVTYHKVPRLLKELLEILKHLEITDEQIDEAKRKNLLQYEHQKFHTLTSYNRYYGQYLLRKVPIVERSRIVEKFNKIKNKDVRKVLKEFQKETLQEGIIFYYAKKNLNRQIRDVLKQNKIKYVAI